MQNIINNHYYHWIIISDDDDRTLLTKTLKPRFKICMFKNLKDVDVDEKKLPENVQAVHHTQQSPVQNDLTMLHHERANRQ